MWEPWISRTRASKGSPGLMVRAGAARAPGWSGSSLGGVCGRPRRPDLAGGGQLPMSVAHRHGPDHAAGPGPHLIGRPGSPVDARTGTSPRRHRITVDRHLDGPDGDPDPSGDPGSRGSAPRRAPRRGWGRPARPDAPGRTETGRRQPSQAGHPGRDSRDIDWRKRRRFIPSNLIEKGTIAQAATSTQLGTSSAVTC